MKTKSQEKITKDKNVPSLEFIGFFPKPIEEVREDPIFMEMCEATSLETQQIKEEIEYSHLQVVKGELEQAKKEI